MTEQINAPESAIPSTAGLGIKWPEGYCTAPNGAICPPAGKEDDFNFGYEIGFQEAWKIMNDAIRNRDAVI